MNATMPMSAEAASERIEYHRIRPWNPAATKHIAATNTLAEEQAGIPAEDVERERGV